MFFGSFRIVLDNEKIFLSIISSFELRRFREMTRLSRRIYGSHLTRSLARGSKKKEKVVQHNNRLHQYPHSSLEWGCFHGPACERSSIDQTKFHECSIHRPKPIISSLLWTHKTIPEDEKDGATRTTHSTAAVTWKHPEYAPSTNIPFISVFPFPSWPKKQKKSTIFAFFFRYIEGSHYP